MRITIQITCDNAGEAVDILGQINKSDFAHVNQKFTPSTEEDLDRFMSKPGKIIVTPTTTEPRPLDEIVQNPPEARPDVSPGEPSIGKIGTETRACILEDLKSARKNPDTYLKGKYKEHLKLLWKRKEVCFDGNEYYLPSRTD